MTLFHCTQEACCKDCQIHSSLLAPSVTVFHMGHEIQVFDTEYNAHVQARESAKHDLTYSSMAAVPGNVAEMTEVEGERFTAAALFGLAASEIGMKSILQINDARAIEGMLILHYFLACRLHLIPQSMCAIMVAAEML